MADTGKVNIRGKECKLWHGHLDRTGYGERKIGGRLTKVHRYAYQQEIGAIPEGLELDHLCRNRACYEVAHLEAVTHAENVRRGLAAVRNRKTHCPQGHAYTQNNSALHHGYRICRVCKRAAARRRYLARKEVTA